jgi:hypothetical protein
MWAAERFEEVEGWKLEQVDWEAALKQREQMIFTSQMRIFHTQKTDVSNKG